MTELPVSRADGSRATVAIERGDITRFRADAIVNAANSSLMGGGGVDGAIHDAAGPALMAELRGRYDRCPAGSAVITGAGRLEANGVRHVVHAVGPVWHGGTRGEAGLLASAYRTSLRLADGAGDRTIALPAISTGAYSYPLDDAASIAVGAVAEGLREAHSIERATFVLYSDRSYRAFERALSRLAEELAAGPPRSAGER